MVNNRKMFCDCLNKGSSIVCKLPITLPTSKVRVKRVFKTEEKEEISPIAAKQTKIEQNDYIEWQISYLDGENLVEFGYLLKAFLDSGKISEKEICTILEQTIEIPTFEDSFRIERVKADSFPGDFKILYEKTPILRLELEDKTFIDIALKHKQRAVGYQAMVYIYIPVDSECIHAEEPLLGRIAKTKEIVEWEPKKEHVLALLKAFLIASETHRQDLKRIISDKLGICKELLKKVT